MCSFGERVAFSRNLIWVKVKEVKNIGFVIIYEFLLVVRLTWSDLLGHTSFNKMKVMETPYLVI